MNKDTISLLEENLFKKDKAITVNQKELVKRYEAIFTMQLDNPFISSKALYERLKQVFPNLSKTQAYIDIKTSQSFFGNVKSASKEYYRMQANELIASAIEDIDRDEQYYIDDKGIEKPTLNHHNIKNKINAAKALVAINKLDKDETDNFDYSEVAIQSFEPTDDPKFIPGFRKKDKTRKEIEETKTKLYNKFGEDIELEEIDFEELENKTLNEQTKDIL